MNPQSYFRGQIETEKIILFSRKHWLAIFPEIVLFFFFLGMFTLILYAFAHFSPTGPLPLLFQVIVVFLIIAIGLLIHHFFLRLIDYFLNVVVITDHRIVDIRKTLLLHDTKESIYFGEIQDVAFTQEGFLKNVLKFGELYITLGGGKEIKVFTHLPNPDYHFRIINDLKNKAFPNARPAV